ncbi:DNA cytosine methyltransferase [Paenibacillus contaminans]|uniref:DNA cytosine methyltransferase n=1 Tax=Paenibacillus contaminans TaxID=450362 RepID=UPI001EDCF225|nr:DNA cytosine methyltransferase [Paenibacillus contaminans]
MRKASLFSGIAGIDLAAQWVGMETVAFCEKEPFCQKVLKARFPGVPIIDDVYDFTRKELEQRGIIGTGRAIDLISIGDPCQPSSLAGKRKGKEDDRHLWPEARRVLEEIRPRWALRENVAGNISMGLDDVLVEMEELGYSAWPIVIPAAGVNASHKRERVFVLGYTEHDGSYGTAFGGSTNQASNNLTQRENETGQSSGAGRSEDNETLGDAKCCGCDRESRGRTKQKLTDGHSGMEGSIMANSKSNITRGLPIGKRTENSGFAFSGTSMANSTSEGLPKRRRSERAASSAQTTTGMESESKRCCEAMAYATSERCGETWGNQPRGAEERFACSCETVANSECFGQSGQGEFINAVHSKENRSREASGTIDGSFRDIWSIESVLGRSADELSTWLDRSGMNPIDMLTELISNYPQPAPLGIPQFEWEPPRVANGVKNRTKRLKALGNAVDPLQVLPILWAIKQMDRMMQK